IFRPSPGGWSLMYLAAPPAVSMVAAAGYRVAQPLARVYITCVVLRDLVGGKQVAEGRRGLLEAARPGGDLDLFLGDRFAASLARLRQGRGARPGVRGIATAFALLLVAAACGGQGSSSST